MPLEFRAASRSFGRNRPFPSTPTAVPEAFPIEAGDHTCSISKTVALRLLVGGSGKQQQILIRIFDDESFGTPGLSSQSLAKSNTGGLKLKKQ